MPPHVQVVEGQVRLRVAQNLEVGLGLLVGVFTNVPVVLVDLVEGQLPEDVGRLLVTTFRFARVVAGPAEPPRVHVRDGVVLADRGLRAFLHPLVALLGRERADDREGERLFI